MSVREIDLSLEQLQMGRKNLRRRMILVPTPPEQSGGTPSCCWPRAGRWRRWSDTPSLSDVGCRPSVRESLQA